MKFRLFDIDFQITFLFVAMVTYVIAMNSPFNVLVTIFSSIFHELGHLIVMSISGNKPEYVRFEITGINIKRQPSIKISTKNELLISLGGPISNLIIFLFSCVLICFFESEKILTVACINLILMVFNLLPIKRLDGGMALYFLLTRKYDTDFCSKILKFTSIVFISIIYAWGIYVFVSTNYNISVLIIAIFLTLSMFGSNEY